ncbi:MAG: Copper binding protein plastocyanin/azurin family [Thermoleophilaceae bacterium]|jgi:plastocyanin|nr:Copper binding protein plastocyanin/azurin family [Thermoleophilaceae bacterium]
MRTRYLVSAAVLALVIPATAAAKDVVINANGNAFTGGLSFTPGATTAKVGDTVSWKNTDPLAPHTSTEIHDLWNVAGDNLGPPITPVPGYAPGATASRPGFEAGTHSYYCVIHGAAAMSGTIGVPVDLKIKDLPEPKGGLVLVRWAPKKEAGRVFDVQRRRTDSKTWITVEKGTKKPKGSFDPGADGGIWKVRARMRSTDDPTAATGWSPVAKI